MTYSGMFSIANTWKLAGTGLEISCATVQAEPRSTVARRCRYGEQTTKSPRRSCSGSGGTIIVRFESERAASQESSSHRHPDERVHRCRSAGDGHGCAGVDGVGVVLGRTAARQNRPVVLGGTTIPTPDKAYLDAVRDLFVGPTHPGDITYVAVTTPEEAWPATGIARVLLFVAGPQSLVGFDGPLWPDEPLWKLSGIFDLTFDQSVQQGIANLEDAIAAHPNEHLVIFGYSQGAMIANIEKQKLADQYPNGDGPDIEFVLIGDENLPNGGLAARFPGLYVPIINLTLNGPAPTDTQFHTTEFVRQYDGFADFPLYPINLAADANAILGFVYVHSRYLDPGPGEPPPIHTTTGDTDYYFYPTDNLPVFGPLRTIGVPEPVIDVVEPVAKVLVEQGYDRTSHWENPPRRG